MLAFSIRRLAVNIPVLGVFSFLMYLVLYHGADPLARLRQVPGITGADIARIRHQEGLDKPWYSGYVHWLDRLVLHGDLGVSFRNQANTAAGELFSHMPATLELVGGALLVATLIGAPLGVFSAVRRYSGFDYVATAFAYVGFAIPVFLLGLLFQLLAIWMKGHGWAIVPFVLGACLVLAAIFHVRKGLGPRVTVAVGALAMLLSAVFWSRFGGHDQLVLPTSQRFSNIASGSVLSLDHLRHLVLPVLTLSIISIAGWSRFQRSATIDVLNADYLRTARAKGLPERTVIGRHGLRNALLPLISVMAVDIGQIFTGAVITESVFGWPGIGSLFLHAAGDRDIAVAMAVLMFGAVMIVVFNLIADIAYGIADPRVRLA